MSGRALSGDGREIPPGSGVVPILRRREEGVYSVEGTGFYVTRYGLVATAKHVFDDIVDWQSRTFGIAHVLEHEPGGGLLARQVIGIAASNIADVAVAQVMNRGHDGGPKEPNMMGVLSFNRPDIGEPLVTFAYPENTVLDFRDPRFPPTLRGDYFQGVFRGQLDSRSRSFMPYAHYETSLEIRSGASGCPVFAAGRIVGIACRGWDFRTGPEEGDNLSSVLPVTQLLPMELECAAVPPDSWEFTQIPEARRGAVLTFAELVTYGHVNVGAL